jgi:hypothetical protein
MSTITYPTAALAQAICPQSPDTPPCSRTLPIGKLDMTPAQQDARNGRRLA